MKKRYVHYIAGGGLGDVVREALYHGALGILKRWKMRHPDAHLKIVTMSHNPSHVDLFAGQDWIDELSAPRFPLELGWVPEQFYDWFPHELEGHTELRFVLPERRSLYRIDLQAQRKRPVPVETIPAIGMACDVELSYHERNIAAHWSHSIMIHPFGGERHKWWPKELVQEVVEAAGTRAFVVGADYGRDGHAEEIEASNAFGFRAHTFAPRVLLEIVRRSRAVVGSESSVYYMGAMFGRPVAMLWPRRGQYDMVKQGKSNWDWYYGEGEPQNLFAPLPPLMDQEGRDVLVDWIRTKAV